MIKKIIVFNYFLFTALTLLCFELIADSNDKKINIESSITTPYQKKNSNELNWMNSIMEKPKSVKKEKSETLQQIWNDLSSLAVPIITRQTGGPQHKPTGEPPTSIYHRESQ